MDGPNPELMERYGTEDVLLMKQAMPGGWGLAGRLALALVAMKGAQMAFRGMEDAQAQAAEMNNRVRALEQLRAMEISVPMRYTRPPMILGPRIGYGSGPMDPVVEGGDVYGIPVGMDQGMVRTAAAIGRHLATRRTVDEAVKQAMGVPVAAAKPGMLARSLSKGRWKFTVPAVAALGVAGVAGGKAMQGAANVMSQENKPADWGNLEHGATRPAYGVGQWGQPTLQSPFIAG